jgi:pimeloyl-ACP methyl ester carboxylesterase
MSSMHPAVYVVLRGLVLILVSVSAGLTSARAANAGTAANRCHFSIYKLADGRLLDIGAADGGDLRWRLSDGQTGQLAAANHWKSTGGWSTAPDGVTIDVPPCNSPDIIFHYKDTQPILGTRIPLASTESTFRSQGVELFGRLVLPQGAGAVPVVVEVHGAEHDAATDFDFSQRIFPAQGVGVYVFDKRGTGRSGGKYTQDFGLLANDVVAAVAEARRLAGTRLSIVGLQGASMGGWVAPLAATKTAVDFVIVDYGLVESPGEENRDQTVVELARKGYGSADLEAAAEVAEATNAVVASHFRAGFDELDAVRARYGSRPWFKSLKGQWTGDVASHSDWVVRLFGPQSDVGTPINYDAVEVLRRVKVPMLWVLAEDDTLAPSATTQQRLRELAATGQSITLLVYPHTDHGIREFVAASDGSRVMTRYADGYFRTTVDFVTRHHLPGSYGSAQFVLAPDR